MTLSAFVKQLNSLPTRIAAFIEPMECLAVPKLNDGSQWVYELRLRSLEVPDCPFVNLPEKHRSRWGEGLTAEDMKKCVCVRPELVAQIEFLEWTDSDHRRHSKFAGLREDKNPKSVVKELFPKAL